nr:hypothetical protein [Tanacetum cinerariifolium]
MKELVLRVPYVPKYHSESENKSWGYSEDDDNNDDDSDDASNDESENDADSDDDVDNDASDSKRTDSDDDENPTFTLKDDKEEEYEDEFFHTQKMMMKKKEYEELYKDVNVRLKDSVLKEMKGDEEMSDATRESVSQEKSYEQVEDDAHVTLTATQKTESSMQSSSVSSDFASKFLILENVPPTDNEVTSMMNVKVRHEESSTQAPSFLSVAVTVIPKTSIVVATTVPLTI